MSSGAAFPATFPIVFAGNTASDADETSVSQRGTEATTLSTRGTEATEVSST